MGCGVGVNCVVVGVSDEVDQDKSRSSKRLKVVKDEVGPESWYGWNGWGEEGGRGRPEGVDSELVKFALLLWFVV